MQEGFITFLFFLHLAIPLRRHLSPPSLHAKLIGWKERKRNGMEEEKEGWKTLCIWKCPERGVIYVCIRCRFHYGPVAQVRSFQEHRGDLMKLSLITGHTGIEGNYWQRQWEKRGKKRKQETDRGGIFTTWTHTPHPQGESKLQSALQERRQRITDRRSPERWVGEKERRNRWEGKCECVFVDNCGQLWTLVRSVCMCVCVWPSSFPMVMCDKPDKLHFTAL